MLTNNQPIELLKQSQLFTYETAMFNLTITMSIQAEKLRIHAVSIM